jgi:hypothetical protein
MMLQAQQLQQQQLLQQQPPINQHHLPIKLEPALKKQRLGSTHFNTTLGSFTDFVSSQLSAQDTTAAAIGAAGGTSVGTGSTMLSGSAPLGGLAQPHTFGSPHGMAPSSASMAAMAAIVARGASSSMSYVRLASA